MKKTSILLSIGLLLSTYGFSQSSFVLKLNGNTLSNNQNIVVSGNPTDNVIQEDFIASGLNHMPSNIRFVRYEVQVPAANTEDYFCWFACYPAFPSGTFPSWQDDDAVPLDNHTNQTMSAYFVPNGYTGTASYRYVLYNQANTSDSISINITFEVGAVSTQNTALKASPELSLYPNPSNGKPLVKLKGYQKDQQATLVISNMLGEQVFKTPIHALLTHNELDLSTLESGLYFYSVQVDGVLKSTQRLIIK